MSEPVKAYERGQVIQIINSVIDKMEKNTAPPHEIIEHITDLAETIDKLKKDIADTDAVSFKESDIQSATDELDAIIEATAAATNDIMAACEQIEKLAESQDVPEAIEYVTNIYVACGFQDITGQRISKVVGALRSIETKVDKILHTLHEQVGPLPGSATAPVEGANDSGQVDMANIDEKKDLLNGPQLPEKGVNQDDIDKLLAEFD